MTELYVLSLTANRDNLKKKKTKKVNLFFCTKSLYIKSRHIKNFLQVSFMLLGHK